jgi:flagellum-specific peptidoglycan hydrolase FlgJ
VTAILFVLVSAAVSVVASVLLKKAGPAAPGPSSSGAALSFTRSAFHETFMAKASNVSWDGIPWRFALAQSDLETGHGTSGFFQRNMNLFNLKVGSGWTIPGGWDGKKSEAAKDGGYFRAYAKWEDSMRDYVHLLHFPRYAKALAAALAGDFKAFAYEVKAAGFDATSPTYAKNLEEVYSTVEV